MAFDTIFPFFVFKHQEHLFPLIEQDEFLILDKAKLISTGK